MPPLSATPPTVPLLILILEWPKPDDWEAAGGGTTFAAKYQWRTRRAQSLKHDALRRIRSLPGAQILNDLPATL